MSKSLTALNVEENQQGLNAYPQFRDNEARMMAAEAATFEPCKDANPSTTTHPRRPGSLIGLHIARTVVFGVLFLIGSLVAVFEKTWAATPNVSECQKALQENPAWVQDLRLPKTISLKVINDVRHDLTAMIDNHLRHKMKSPVSPRDFNRLLKSLTQYARNHQIVISETLDTIGVFPKGVFEVGVSGLAVEKNNSDTVSFASLHELAHLFHVVMIRSILIKNYHLDTRKGKAHLESAEKYLEDFEGGMNYIEFEEMVTETSAFPHAFNEGLLSKQSYKKNLIEILNVVQQGIPSQHIDHRVQYGLPGLYALFLSRVPLVLGKSLGDLAMRMPFILFVTEYLVNSDFKNWVDHIVQSAL